MKHPLMAPFLALALLCPACSQPGAKPFEANVESLQAYKCPEWFRDAKFGIYLHWGAYSVAERGEWYARELYLEETEEYEHHVATYGHPSEFGYADFIPTWKAERFDPAALVALFKRAGARYFTPCAVHHDNFDLWDSKHHEWNAVEKGPRRDLIGMWREATLAAGLRFGVTTHLSRSYSWLNPANGADTSGDQQGIPYDGAQGKSPGLYPPNDGQSTHQRAPLDAPDAWRELWARRIKQLVDDYEPDLLYFDCAVPFRGADRGRTGMGVIAHFYNQRPEGVMCIKRRPWQGLYAEGIATLDFERGKADAILDAPWQTDDSIGSWGYNPSVPYMEPGLVVDKLIDIVSKNGNLLLNIPIRADGTLDQEATDLLLEVGEWLSLNGEAIYGTRPWAVFGEGYRKIGPEDKQSKLTSRDLRYTTKDGVLYAFVMGWPEPDPESKAEAEDEADQDETEDGVDQNEAEDEADQTEAEGEADQNEVEDEVDHTVTMEFVTELFRPAAPHPSGKIKSVRLLGHDGPLDWDAHPDGLRVTLPDHPPCKHAYTLKISFE